MADTTNKQENTDINYDSPLMTDNDSDSLAKMNLENYDVKDTTNVTKEVDSYNTEKVASNYGIDSDKVIDNENSKTDSKTDSRNNSKDNSKDNSKKETTTHTNLPMDENDENYTSPMKVQAVKVQTPTMATATTVVTLTTSTAIQL